MNETSYADYGDVAAAEPETDPRVVAMQRVVDLEQKHNWAQRDADERQKKAAVIGDELSEARDELNGLLGLPNRGANKSVGINVVNGYGR